MDPKRQESDPHFERLHGPPLSYARSLQSFLQIYDPQPASTIMDFPAEASEFSRPTVPDVVDFAKGKVSAGDMLPPPTPGLLSGVQTPCEGTCSVTNCESGCNPSVVGSGTCSLSQCNNLDQCTSEECCKESACLDHDSVPTTRRESIDFGAEDQYDFSSQHQFANSSAAFPAYENLPGFDNIDDDPVQCHWLLPDQECDITAPTKDALSQHVFHDHIQPEMSLTCGWSDCEEQVDAQQLTDHLWSNHRPEQHVPDSYVCLWDGCMEMFSDAEQLETHMEGTHTHMESIDCRWGGCGTITTNSAELQSHVNEEHLHLHTQPSFSSPDLEMDLSDSRRSRPRKKHPLYWSPENDDLLMRVRAQNLTFQQISSQYFPDKSTRACQMHYAVLWNRQQQSAPQSTEQSTPLLSYSPLPPSSPQYPSIDPPLSQTSPALLSNHSSQLILDHPPTQGKHECLWITDDATGKHCGARFGHPNELQAHVDSSHYPLSDDRRGISRSKWVCKWMGCLRKGETSRTREKLKKHIYTHTGFFSVSCRHCGKTFRDNTKLANHERIHTKEKPHKCDVCEMAFASRDGLSTHNRIHTGEKPLECGKCSYTCSDSSNMTKHRRSHEPPLFTCPTCGKKFCRADSRDRHIISAGAKSKVKSSVQRAIRAKVCETYPLLAPHIDEIIPKKSQLDLLKLSVLSSSSSSSSALCSSSSSSSSSPPHFTFLANIPSPATHYSPDRVSLYALDRHPLFWQHMDDPLIPHLKTVHQFPHCFARIGVDRGAIRFVLAGAALMAPGLTSAGGKLPDPQGKEGEGELREGDVAVVEAEGKEEACLVGRLRMGTEEIRGVGKGVVMDAGHFLGDGLWRVGID